MENNGEEKEGVCGESGIEDTKEGIIGRFINEC